MVRTTLIVVIVLSLSHGYGRAEDSTRVNYARLVAAGTFTLGTTVAVHLYQQQAWWQGPRAPFRFENDWKYALNIDKFGHTYGAYVLSHTFMYTLSWIGYSDATSRFWGPMLGLSYELYVEIEDGYHKDYGFSPGDGFSDIIGAAIPAAQAAFPVLRNFRLKWSYFPSREYLDALKQQKNRVFIDDYEGQIYWLSVDPHFMMSSDLSGVIPAWLGLSFGAAVKNLSGDGGGQRMFYFTLDYNLSKIETESSLLHAVFTAIDFFHLPAPGIAFEDRKIKLKLVY